MVISGCGGGGGDSATSGTPNIGLVPAQTDFGVVALDKSADKNIAIFNTGTANLSIGQVSLPANPFTMISDSCSGADIPRGAKCELTIRFSPTTQVVYNDSFDIPSNDGDAGLLTATLLGTGRALNVSINRVVMIPGTQTVQIVVSVKDRFDAPVTTLEEGNISIVENGSPQTIDTFFINTIKPPVSVGMVLDYSSSTISNTLVLETAAKSFVDLLDPVTDEAEVTKFATDIELMQSFTQDNVLLKDAIDRVPLFARLGTHLYDALDTSIISTSLRSNPRLAIVAVSDGNEGGSARTIGEVTAHAVDSNVQIFTIGIGAVDNVIMQQLAADTGGQYFYIPDSSDLTDLITVYSTISEILSNEYTIEYTTSSAPGSTISLDVMVNDSGQLGEASGTVGL